ncbi:MAG: KEOPS complex subunit Cgi121 [Candidatus Bathyarchaeota archaeon]|nr:KEOPS complex subunit Cgi121 [Candidatus Bathyarchaeota archaeon]
MLKYISEFGNYVAAAGFRNAKIDDVDVLLKSLKTKLRPEIVFQLFDARLIATSDHLLSAALNALKAFRNGENISRNLSVELLLYASAQRQIRKAAEILGIKSGAKEIAALVISENPEDVKSALAIIEESTGAKRDDSVLELSEEKITAIRRVFGITETEIETMKGKYSLQEVIKNLVIERVALLYVWR